jgi:hypothetical protein
MKKAMPMAIVMVMKKGLPKAVLLPCFPIPATIPTPHSLVEVMQQCQQVKRQSERLSERVGEMLERLELLEKNQRTLADKHGALEDAFHQEKTKKTLGY